MKRKLLLVVLLFLPLLLVGCGKEKEIVKEVTPVKRNLTTEEINGMMGIINDLEYMDYYNKNIVPVKLNNQEVLRISYEVLESKGKVVYGELTFSELEEVARNYLGFSLEPENLICDTHFVLESGQGADILIYDVDTGIYNYNNKHLGHGAGGLESVVYNSYSSGYELDGTYTIVVKKLFSEILGDIYEESLNYYPSYSDAQNGTNKLFSSSNVDDSYFIQYGDKLKEYTYTFKLVDNHYILTSYTIN